MKPFLVLLLIIFSFGLRFYNLNTLPNGLYWDEQDTGYQAYSLLKTGKDYFGNPIPLFPHSLADWRTPVNIYSSVPLVAVFGLRPVSVRLPAVIFGTLSIFCFYYLSRLLFGRIAALSAFLLAVSPWHLLYTRYNGEVSSMFLFLTLGLLTFFKGFSRPRYLLISFLSFALSMASYSPAKLFIPVLLVFLIYIYSRCVFTQHFFKLSLLIFLTLALPVFLVSSLGPAGTRFHDLAVYTDPQLGSEVDRQRLTRAVSRYEIQIVGQSPSILDRLFVNKPLLVITRIINGYLDAFSPQFLFTRGDAELRHSFGNHVIGQLLYPDLILIVLGLIFLFSYQNKNLKIFLFLLLLLSPLPAALTRDGGAHASRSFLLVLPLYLFIALGLKKLYFISKNIFILFSVFYILSAVFFIQYVFSFYRLESAKPFNWGFQSVISQALDLSASYDRVYIDFYRDSPLMSYLFQTSFPPSRINTAKALDSVDIGQGLTAYRFGKVYLLTPGQRYWQSLSLTGKNLVVAISDQPEINKIPRIIRTVNYPDSTPAFFFFEK